MSAEFKISSESAPKGCHAFKLGSELTISLSVNGLDCRNIWLYVGNDDRVFFGREVKFTQNDGGFVAEYTFDSASLTGLAGLFFCHFEFIDGSGKRYYTAFEYDDVCYLSDRYINEIQFLLYGKIYESPAWLKGGAVYQIFPDRFARGGKIGRRIDAVYNGDWENGIPEYPSRVGEAYKNNTHFGGTLWGAEARLPYLKNLGVTCVYLNPVVESFSNHKYDTGDFLNVDPTFGGNEALESFIHSAHSLGISVILDGVFNHVGDDSIYFNRYGRYPSLGAYQSKESPYYGWFKFDSWPNQYESWWGIKNLPRVVRTREYRDFITTQVIPRYMAMGVDGWRLDVVDELEGDFLDELVSAIRQCKPDAVIIGEVWEDASNKQAYGERKRYFHGGQLDSVTNYPLRNAIIDYVTGNGVGLLKDTVNALYRHYPVEKQQYLLNFLGSHDTERILTILGGDIDEGEDNSILAQKRMSPEQRARAEKLLKCAYTLLASMPGVPCIFYGDEIGMEGYHDPFNRRPFPESGFTGCELSDHISAVNKLRGEYKELFLLPKLTIETVGENGVVLTRSDENRRLYAVGNMGKQPISINLPEKTVDIMGKKVYNETLMISEESVLLLRSDRYD